jgi:tetratricopeptide (TPR) repeat protein
MLLLSKAYSIDPEDWRIHQLFALNYAVFEMPYSVELELKKAIRLNQTNAELYYQLGRLYFSEERFEESIEQSKRALSIKADYPEPYDSLALAYEGMGQSKEAGDNYRKAIELDRKYGIKDEWPLIDYGTLLLHEESPEVSLPFLMAALEINPSSPKANYQTGRAMRALNREQEAEKYFAKTIASDPSYSYAYYQLATLLLKRGDGQGGAALMNKYKALMDHEKRPGTYRASDSEHMAR